MARRSNSKIIAALTLVVLTLGLLWWLGRDDATGEDQTNADPSSAASSTSLPDNLQKHPRHGRIDPFEAPRATVTGTVRDEQARPIAEAQVCALVRDADILGDDRLPPQCTTTRADGTYRLGQLLGAGHQLHASAQGYIAAQYEHRPGIQQRVRSTLELSAGATTEGIDFVLTAGGVELTGVIKDIAGGVIEGAWVSSGADSRRRVGTSFTRSDEDGRFSLWVEAQVVRVRASAEGYADGSRRAAAPGTVVEVFLTPESIVIGKVVWADSGEPVAGAPVGTGGRGSAGEALTQPDGTFRMEGLQPGSYKVRVTGDEYIGMADQKVHVGLGQTSEPIVVKVHPALSVRGTVLVDGETPCSFGTVSLVDKERKNESRRGSDPEQDGSVLVRGLLPGTYEVTVACRDHVPEREYPDIVLTDASVEGLAWSVHTGQSVQGRVIDAHGEPVAQARVSAQAKAGKDPRAQRISSWGIRTEPDGTFTLRGLLPGAYELSAYHHDRPRPDQPTEIELAESEDLEDVTITLPAGGRVEGVVRDEKGTAVADVSVRLTGGRWGGFTRTNDEGSFVQSNVRAGEYRIIASRGWRDTMRAPGASDDDKAGERIDVRAGETTEVELVVESQSGRITGRVLGESGEPVEDAFVRATRESDSAGASEAANRRRARWGSWGRQPVLTDADGRFELTDLVEGATYSVHANRKGGGDGVAEHVAEGSDVEVSIAPVGVLAGVVRIDGGGVPERFSIVARDRTRGLSARDEFFRTEGRWTLTNMEPGTYEVVVDASEGNDKTEVELAEGAERTDIELVLTPRITITGTLVDAESGEPVPGLRVSAAGEGGRMRFRDTGKADAKYISGTDGTFTVEDVTTGKVRLLIKAPGFTDDAYSWTTIHRRLSSEPAVQDLGRIELNKRRLERGEEAGDLGFKVEERDPSAEPEERRTVIAFIRPGGPAAAAGLAIGDEIVGVDGQSVVGVDSYRYGPLTRVEAGTSLRLKIGHGEDERTVTLTVGPPI